MPSVVITGGCGFLGAALAQRIADHGVTLPDGQVISDPEIILIDRAGITDPGILNARYVPCDVTDANALRAVIPDDTVAAYHLAAVVSGQAEADFDLGMQVNVDGTRAVMATLHGLCPGIPVVGTSSLAVYGANATAPLTEDTATQPTSTYGVTKAFGELLFADYRRRGWLDARILRLPTITVRPGKPNAAASSFVSSIIREPLAGEAANCPIDPDFALWVASPDAAVAALHHALAVPAADWPGFGAVNVPGLTVTPAQMLEALRAVDAGAADLVTFEHDPKVEAIVCGWPAVFDCALADRLGFAADADLAAIIMQALQDRPS